MSRPRLYTPEEARAEAERGGDDRGARGCLAEGGCCLLEVVGTAAGGLCLLVGLPLLMR